MGITYGNFAVFEWNGWVTSVLFLMFPIFSNLKTYAIIGAVGVDLRMRRFMKTLIIKMDENNPDPAQIAKAGDIIKNGGLVAFPTETVYGLGGDALNPDSSRKIYAAKGRPSDNPLIVHICCFEDIYKIVKNVPESAKRLAEAYWPGPLTMRFMKSDAVPAETTGGLDTVAVRMPDNPIALKFIKASGGYIAAPSANTSGRPSPTLAQYVAEDMDGRIEMILDGGQVGIGLESTIVDLTEEIPMILRPGYITREMLSEVLGQVDVDQTILSADSGQAPKAPGMKYRHYAPKGDLTIIEGNIDTVIAYINEKAELLEKQGERIGIIGTDSTVSKYNTGIIKSVGNRKEEETVARELYRVLREFDDEEVTVIFSESFERKGIGQAIMNRLLKAAGHKVVEV